MDNNEKMDIFTTTNIFIHRLDVVKVSVRTLDKSENSNWIVNIGGNVLLWFDNKEEIINFADKISFVVNTTEVEEKVNSETNT